ncbi:MAG: hypothetical protein PHU85_03980, partial [Phycisphaerae bacterium]|nr:hypothetical protein [Phycisphaerae bacterium]
MALRIWLGTAPNVAQVETGVLSCPIAGAVFSFSIGDSDDAAMVYTCTTANVAAECAAMAAAWNASTNAYLAAVTAVAGTNSITFTADAAGTDPGSIAVDVSGVQITPTDEIQALMLPDAVTSGSFTLSFQGVTTASLPFNANAAELQAALEALSTIGTGNIVVEDNAPTSGQFILTFGGALASAQQPQIVPVSALLAVSDVDVEILSTGGLGQDEYTQLAIPASALSGTFLLIYAGETTAELTYSSTADDIQTALEALSTVGTGNVAVATTATSGTFVLHWTGELGQSDIDDFYATSYLAGNAQMAITVNEAGETGIDEKQKVAVYNTGVQGGTWVLISQATSVRETTGALTYTSTAADVQTALQALTSIGAGNVLVTGGTSGTYYVTWAGTEANQGQSILLTQTWWTVNDAMACTVVTQGVPGPSEVWQIVVANYTDGTFNIGYAGQSSAALAFNTNAATVQAALQSVASIGTGNVLVTTVTAPASTQYYLTFSGMKAGIALPYPVVVYDIDLGSLVPATMTSTITGSAGSNAVLTLTVTSTGNTGADYGLFRWQDVTDTLIVYFGTTAADLVAAMDAAWALWPIGSGNVSGSGGPLGTAPVVLEFINDWAKRPVSGYPYGQFIFENGSENPLEVTVDLTEGVEPTDAVHTLAISTCTSGTYTLTFGGSVAALNYNSNAAQVVAALEALPTIGTGNVFAKSGSTMPGSMELQYTNTLGEMAVTLPTIGNYLFQATVGGVLTSTKTTSGASGTNCRQWIRYNTAPVGGTWSITMNSQTTGSLNHSAFAAEVRNAIQALPSMPANSVEVTGDWNTGYYVTFGNYLRGMTIAAVTLNDAAIIIGGVQPSVTRLVSGAAGANALQTMSRVTGVTGGTYLLSFDGYTTTGLAWNAATATIQAALAALTSIGTGNVVVRRAAATTDIAAGTHSITFTGTMANAAQAAITATSYLLGATQELTITTNTEGI